MKGRQGWFGLPAIVLILAGLGLFVPLIVSNTLPGLDPARIERVITTSGSVLWGVVIGALAMIIVIALRQDELAVTLVIATKLYIDWYLGPSVVSHLMTLVLLFIYFLTRSSRYPWIEPRGLWLWLLFLVLAIPPAIAGALTSYDAGIYYPHLIFGAFIIFWLGTVVARNGASVLRLFQMLAAFATLIALHTIILSTTGVFLLGSARYDLFLASVSNFQLAAGITVQRLGSFFIDPNWNGTFLAMILFLPLGLFVESTSFKGKIFYLTEVLLILLALLFTYSAGAWVAALIGILSFAVFAGQGRYRVQVALFILAALVVMLVGFPSQVNLLLQHATDPTELSLRVGAWQTALQVIRAFPLSGVGLGFTAYEQRAEPYRVPAQIVPLVHPHNSYLELGAMGGLPLLTVFIALLGYALWLALRNWAQADRRTRSLLGAGITAVIVLSCNSWTINGWTLPPIAGVGWLILGVTSSPLLAKSIKQKNMEK